MQKVIVFGNVGQDPELRRTNDQTAVVNFSLADTERWKDKQGEQQSRTEWFRCKCFGPQAELIAKYVKKGNQLMVIGKMRTSEWEKDGEKRYSTDLAVDNFEFVGSRNDSSNEGYKPPSKPQSESVPAYDEEDIPFN